jgi:pimeloyl-ACP methyl ester carboxylesterase
MLLAHQRSGKPGGKKIVFLHGMGGTGKLWRPIAALLEAEFDLLTLDQRGHGGSQIPSVSGARTAPSYTPLDYGRDVVETCEAIGFSPAWFVGHSMGVRTACAVAHLAPPLVRGLVLVDLGFHGVAGGGLGEGLAQFLRKLPTRFASREEARAFMTAQCPDPSIAQYLMAVSERATDGTVGFPFDHGALQATIQAARDVSVRGWVREVGERGTPVLVLRGARSLVWSAEDYAAEAERFRGLASIQFRELEDAGHGLPFEKRAEFCALVRATVERVF